MHTPDALQPYLEESTERILETNDLLGELQLCCGGTVERLNVDPDGVTASSFTRFSNDSRDDRAQHISLINQHAAEAVDDIDIVWDRTEALNQETHAVWVMTDGDAVEYPHPLTGSDAVANDQVIRLPADVYVYERIPFTDSVESVADLTAELETALSHLSDDNISITLDNVLNLQPQPVI
jgi:hypothetical protein